MSKPILYTYFRSSASWRVRIALAYKGIEYEQKYVNLLKKEQYGEDYLKINPLAQVPALLHNGHLITQSVAILEYLEEVVPGKPLMPKDPLQRARVRELCEIIGSGIQPLQNTSVIGKIDSEDASKRIEWAKFWVEKGFNALEKLLSQTSGKYCVGDELTLADLFLAPQVAQANRFMVDVSKYPNISRLNQTLKELDAFKKGDAFTQPDCPEELRAQQKLD
jgi:maleylacetoacetate isomerase